MKWMALLAGAAMLLAAWLLSWEPQERRDVATAAAPVSAVAPAPPAKPPAPPAPEGLGDVALHGVIIRGPDGAGSQVLLKVDGQPEQVYRVGDLVARGWSVHEVRAQEVVLANGATRTRLAVVAPAPAPATRQSAPARPAPSAPAPMPGFIAGPPPSLTDAGASERNRRFLEAVQGRAGTRQ